MRCAVVVLREAEEGHTGVAYGETVVKMMSTMVYSGSNGFSQREAVTPEQDSNFCRKRLKEGHKKGQNLVENSLKKDGSEPVWRNQPTLEGP